MQISGLKLHPPGQNPNELNRVRVISISFFFWFCFDPPDVVRVFRVEIFTRAMMEFFLTLVMLQYFAVRTCYMKISTRKLLIKLWLKSSG